MNPPNNFSYFLINGIRIEVLKVPHHGSKTGLLDETIRKLSPRVSIIEVGKNNYGHPNSEVIEKLKQFGKVLTTRESKTIEVSTDGIRYQVLPQIP